VLFNLALLAKRVWRMLVNPESLAASVLRARYFPRGDVLTAGLGYNPSFTWRSLITGRGLLLKGLSWTTGHGERVRIWRDKWVMNYGNFFIGWPPVGLEERKVKDLMDDGEAS